MGSENARLSVDGYGSRLVIVTKIDYSIESFFEEGAAARYKVHYPLWMMDTAFTVTFAFPSSGERHVFCHWMQDYMERVTTNRIKKGAMHVSVPARKYARWGVPTGNLLYGDTVTQAGRVYLVAISFLGATNPVSSKAGTSSYRAPKKQAGTTSHFYPAGDQRSGKSMDNALFDIVVDLAKTSDLLNTGIHVIDNDTLDGVDAGTAKSR